MIFYYHSGAQAIVMPSFEEGGKPLVFPTKLLRELGWKANDQELRELLPRADVSPILMPGGGKPGLALPGGKKR